MVRVRIQQAGLWLSGLVFISVLVSVSSQERKQTNQPWLNRATALTNDLMYDAPRLDRYERVIVWARIGEAWWKADPEQSRNWFVKAVELLESSSEVEKSSLSCKLAASRVVLGIITTRDKALHERLLSVIGANKDNQPEDERRENATALADAGLSLVANDPQEAERLGEASLRLGFSLHLAQLLWKLRPRDQELADKLFTLTAQVAVATRDFNFFSMLTTAAFQGPFSSDYERRLVLRGLAEVLRQPISLPSNITGNCNLAVLLPPLLQYYDALFPDQAPGMRATLTLCRRSQVTSANKSIRESSDRPLPTTVDDFLNAATESSDQAERDLHLLKAAQQAAGLKDWQRAIKILDSIENGQTRLGDSWEGLRWDFASSLACEQLRANNPSAMSKVIESSPLNLRAFVRISLLTKCEAQLTNVLFVEISSEARNDLEKAAASDRPAWYLALVRQYVRFSLAEAPAVLNEAIASINRTNDENLGDCRSDRTQRSVLTYQLLLNRYKLPATLLEVDEVGVRSALGSIGPADKRAAIRLQLLNAAVEQHLKSFQKASPAVE